MLHAGENLVEGIPVEVVRKRVRRISIRIGADGRVVLNVPKWWATLRQGEEFLRSKLKWVRKTREDVLSRPQPVDVPLTDDALAALKATLGELQDEWTARLREAGVAWKLRKMKTLWGSCHFRKRVITYNTELASAPRELIEYVVVHELTHLVAHDHGPNFYRHMDERLPGWRELRTRLNRREFLARRLPPRPIRLVQAEFAFMA